jgi:hypothetical protein
MPPDNNGNQADDVFFFMEECNRDVVGDPKPRRVVREKGHRPILHLDVTDRRARERGPKSNFLVTSFFRRLTYGGSLRLLPTGSMEENNRLQGVHKRVDPSAHESFVNESS